MMRPMRETRTLWSGRKFDVREVEVDIGAGGPRAEVLVVHPGSVVIVPLLDDGRVLLIRNRRYAVDQCLLELPAGTREPPEEPLACAQRELREETGFAASNMERIGGFWLAPSFSTERMDVFLARGLTHCGQDLDEGEEIDVVPVTRRELERMIIDGDLCDAKSLAALRLWELRGVARPRRSGRMTARIAGPGVAPDGGSDE